MDIFKKTVWTKLKKCATDKFFNEYDVAEIVHDMYKHQYICVDVEKNIWYRYINERWRIAKGPVCLKKKLFLVDPQGKYK